MKTPDRHSSGPSASQVETKETPENTEGDPDTPEPAHEGGIQMEYSTPLIGCAAKV